MAIVTSTIYEPLPPLPPPPTVAFVTLRLSREEAVALIQVCDFVAGDPDSLRGVFDGRETSINRVLIEALGGFNAVSEELARCFLAPTGYALRFSDAKQLT